MTDAQEGMYFREWGRVRRILRANGLAPADCDARRHQVHIEELGEDKSHLEFTEDDFDAVLAGFWKISYPDDLARQLRQINMRKTRALYTIDQLLVAMGKNRRFAEGVAQQIEDGLDPNSPDALWQHERQRESPRRPSLAQLSPTELKKVMSALRSISARSTAPRAPARDRARDRSPSVQPASAAPHPF